MLAVRLLGSAAYGALAFGLSVAVVFAGLGRLGLEPAVAREIAVDEERGSGRAALHVARGALGLVALTGVLGGALTFVVIRLGAPGVDAETGTVLGLALGLAVYGANVAAVSSALARGVGRVVLMEIPNLVATVGRFVTVAVLVVLDVADLTWVAAGYALAAIAGIVVSWRIAHRLVRSARVLLPSRATAQATFVGALPFAVVGLSTVAISRLDVVVLGLTGTSIEVGDYEPALRVVEQAMLIVPLLFAAQYLPVASRSFRTTGHGEFRELFVGVSKLAFVFALPAVIVLAAFPEAVLGALYGSSFPASGTLVWLLLPGFVANLAFGMSTSALAATGARRALARTGIVATVAMAVLAVTLIPSFGAEGAAVATSVTFVVLNVWVAGEVLRTTRVHVFRADFVVTLASAAAPVCIALLVRAQWDGIGLGLAAVWSIGLSVAWVAALLATGIISRHELTRLVPRSA